MTGDEVDPLRRTAFATRDVGASAIAAAPDGPAGSMLPGIALIRPGSGCASTEGALLLSLSGTSWLSGRGGSGGGGGRIPGGRTTGSPVSGAAVVGVAEANSSVIPHPECAPARTTAIRAGARLAAQIWTCRQALPVQPEAVITDPKRNPRPRGD